MPTPVTDSRSNANDQIAHAARVIGRSENRRAVFDAVCTGKKQVKSVSEIIELTGLDRKQVLNAGKALESQHVVQQVSKNGETAYQKDGFYAAQKKRILSLVDSPQKLAALPTKTNPQGSARAPLVQIVAPRSLFSVKPITVDDVSSFAKVKAVRRASVTKVEMPEARFKRGIQAIVGEQGRFRDWGGERNDLLTTRLRLGGGRTPTAFAFKGPGRRGRLTPARMGKNGDQIQRLFQSEADVFLVQYWDQVDESVYEQMRVFAIVKSIALGGKRIHYGVIDGTDSARLIKAYPKKFR